MSWLVGQFILGWLLADLVTGVFHWWEDNFGSPDWPIIGPWLIAPNRLHHSDPLAFTQHGFLTRNMASITAAAIVGAASVWLAGPSPFLVSLLVGGAISNEVHRYAHQPSSAGRIIQVFQEVGLLQSAKSHAVHHRPPHDRNYCILTDWLNPSLEALGFWMRLERLIGRTA